MGSYKKALYIVVCVVLLITSLIVGFIISARNKRDVSIYVIKDGMCASPETYRDFIDENEPVITGKDIKGYNPELKIFFLSDEKMRAYRNAIGELDDEVLDSTSIILGAGISDGFIVAVDGKPAFGGHVKRPMAVSFVPNNPVIKDCEVGLEIGTYGFNEEVVVDDSLLVDAFKEMRLITNKIPPTRGKYNYRGIYYPDEMWRLRDHNINDCFRMVSLLPVSDNLELHSGSTRDIDFPMGNSEKFKAISADYVGNGSLKDYEIQFDRNARVLFALYDGLELVKFNIRENEGDDDFKSAVYISSDVIDYLPEPKSGDYYKSVARTNLKIRSELELYKYLSGKILENSFNIMAAATYGEPTGVVKVDGLYKEQVDEKAKDIIESGLKVIMSSHKSSSNPYSYIKEHSDDYEKMLKHMGDSGLDYILMQFKHKKAKGLRGELLAIIANDYVDEKVDEWDSPIKWYQQYVKKVESEIKLPDYDYEPAEHEEYAYLKKELYKFDLDEYKDDREGFTVDIFHIVGTAENEDLVKVFTVRRRNKYRLYGEVLQSVCGGNYPMAVTLRNTINGYELVKVEHALDGSLHVNSIIEMCKDPLTNEKLDDKVIRDISKEMMYNDKVSDYFKNMEDVVLKRHLLKNGVEKAILYSPFDEVSFEL